MTVAHLKTQRSIYILLSRLKYYSFNRSSVLFRFVEVLRGIFFSKCYQTHFINLLTQKRTVVQDTRTVDLDI